MLCTSERVRGVCILEESRVDSSNRQTQSSTIVLGASHQDLHCGWERASNGYMV